MVEDYHGPKLEPGTRVVLDSKDKDHLEYGIVVHCWLDEHMKAYDCHVAFYGRKLPVGKPVRPPNVLRYLTASLHVVTD